MTILYHVIDQDDRYAFDWDDNTGDDITVDEVTWTVLDTDGTPVTGVGTATIDDTLVRVHIADDEGTPGNYTYELRARSGPDWYTISAGLLRIIDPAPEVTP